MIIEFAMRGFIAVLIVAAALSIVALAVDIDPPSKFTQYMTYTDDNGTDHLVDLYAEPDYDLLNYIENYYGNMTYLLYTRSNPTTAQTLFLDNDTSILSSNYNSNLTTVYVVHGWLNTEYSTLNPTIRDAYLGVEDVNVIVVGWKHLSHADYVTAATGVPAIGRALGKFIAYVASLTGASYESLHLIGFSLGAHVVGNAGRELGGQPARITGLDPAGPLFINNTKRLNSTDAVYVEGIHTNGAYVYRVFGIGIAIGHSDFYPNGGVRQPGCLTDNESHGRSWQLCACSITNNYFVGKNCSSSSDIALGTCYGTKYSMGNSYLNNTGTGLYYLTTTAINPYYVK